MKKVFLIAALVLSQVAFVVGQTCVFCDQTPLGTGASIIGNVSTADGQGSIAIGTNAHALSNATSSIAIGTMVKTIAGKSIVIGCGSGVNAMLTNTFQESLMIGFNSSKPTMFVSRSPYEGTGTVGIGNVVDEFGILKPLAKLHLRADEGEDAAIFIQPYNWLEGDVAGIYLGIFLHGIKADTNTGITFLSEKNYVYGMGNVGLGVEQPKAKLHIDGNILFENPADGFIMKSENGQCWKVTINNDGSFNSTMVDCENYSGTHINKETKHTPLYFYPNPTSGLLTIDNRSNTHDWIVEFRSLNGTLLKSSNLASGTNGFDLNFAAEGMLIVSVYDQLGNLVSSEKIVVK